MTEQFERLATALADRYRLEHGIGRGAMATVYLAHDIKHDRHVALKVLNPELARAIGSERFLREITLTARLDHPHVLPLLDSGEAEGFLYYVMPYVEGETLRDRLNREKQLPLDDAIQISREVSDALSYSHSHGIVHRDIKPENILLGAGHARVSDFGIARAVDAAGGDRLTETGLAIGTPAYMSPEQAAGSRDLDGRSDLYSLACVVYEMLAGRPPFTGPTVESLVHQHLTAEPPSITSMRPVVPTTVAAALQRALSKTPADRFNPVALFAEALAKGGTTPGPAAGADTWVGARTLVIGAAVIVVAAAVTALLLPRTPAAPTAGRATQVTFDPGLELDAAISPDGRTVAYAAGPLGDMLIYVRQVAGGRALAPATDVPGSQRRPLWSPDGSKLLFMAGDRLYEVPAFGGLTRLVVTPREGNLAHRGAWSPDGTKVAFLRGDTIYLRELATGLERALTQVTEAHSLAWSPDGRWIAFVSGNPAYAFGTQLFGNIAPASIQLANVADGALITLTEGPHLNVSPAWLPDGRLLFISNRAGLPDIYVQPLSRHGRPRGPPHRLTTGLRPHSISVSADGRTLAYSTLTRRQNIWSLPIPASGTVSSTRAEAVTIGNQVIEGIAISPDGRWLAFDSDRAGNQDVYKRALSGGELIQLTDHPSDEFVNSWSPDGQWLAGHGFRRGNRDPFAVRVDGTGFQLLDTHPAHDRYPDWSPDGERIVFLSERSGTPSNLFLIERRGPDRWTDARQLTLDGAMCGGARWSPDGRWIAYCGPEASVRLVAPQGGEPRLLARGPESVNPTGVAWSADGAAVVYQGIDQNGIATFWSVPATGGAPRLLVRFEKTDRRLRGEFVVHRGRLYFTIGEFESDVWVTDLTPGI